MKIEVISQGKDTLEFYIEGERHTLPNILREKVLQTPGIEFCAYRLEHPLDKKARFVVKGSNPKKALENAVKEIKADMSEFKKAFSKAK